MTHGKHKNKLGCIVILVLLAVFSAAGSARAEEKTVLNTLLWSLFIPGGGHYYLGQENAGSAYVIAEGLLCLGGASTGGLLSPGEWNYSYVTALKVHELGIFTSYREARALNNDGYTTPIDSTPVGKLYLAPFKPENFTSPYVYCFMLAGAGINALEASFNAGRKDYDSVAGVRVIGTNFDREAGTALYGCMWITLSLNAAVGEECAYRGFFQAECEESMGRTAGLLVSSGLFGLGHVSDWSSGSSWASGGIASLCGLYLGWLFQREGYQLEKPIAAHFWFDVAAGTTLFIMDPANNPIGLKVDFKF